MDYDEAINADDITRSEAKHEIEEVHDLRWCDFVEEVGLKDLYTGEEVLGWLGY